MGWGGSALAMILSLKANARPKRRPFEKDVEVRPRQVRSELLRPASPDVLEHWRERAQQAAAHRRRLERWGLVLALLLSGAILWWLFA
jgi:hypothetical protein